MSSDDMIRIDLPLSPDEMHLEAVQREWAAHDRPQVGVGEERGVHGAVQCRFDVLTRVGGAGGPTTRSA
jgi:hypothetical protein